ncbi:MAG: valine--tRNA ligase [Alphaproteobacteria bacterium]
MALDKTFDPQNIEDRHYKDWEQSGAFQCDATKEAAPYTIMMPPPNVTGSLHMGHALNTTLQDLLTRYYRMNGRDALWQPGTDHAGIATQMVVERMLDKEGISRHDLGREKFLERVWDWKAESGGTIVKQMRALGATPDWSRERFTMDEGLSKAVRKVFVQLYKEGLIYKDKRLVNWDTKLLTSISDLEVESKDQKGKMWHIRYPIEGEVERFITVATTRPETLLGDTAVAVNPEDDRYKSLIGASVALPLTDRLIPIIADEHADPENGSGAVKITPAHDFNDYEVGKRHDLPMVNILDIHGHLNENAPEKYQGMERFKARKAILAELEDLDLLVKVEDIQHTVPYGDRSGTIIEPYLTDQWYVDAKTMAEPAIKAVETGEMEFVPKQWENTYYAWMRDIQPWCISRQLWWGHQIPAWYDMDGNVYVAESEEEAQEQAGAGVKITRDDDVLDTWFSSALWPFSTLGWPDKTPELEKYYQTDVLLTGFDIIFFWVARMMMMGIHFMGEVPFKTVYMHALVRDSKGQKMSKSKGNVMDPLDLTQQYGADALRFTMIAMAAQGRDIKMAEERLQGYRNFATKLWNATRYCEMNECLSHDGFDPASVTFTPNQWVIHEVVQAKAEIEKAIETYRFNEAANAVYSFVWGTFCDWYLEISKPVLQEGEEALATEVRQTTSWVLEQILTILNPFMPYITEELYASISKRDEEQRLLTSAWPQYEDALHNEDSAIKMEWLQRVVSEIRSVRSDMNVPAGAKIDLLVKDACETTKEGFDAYRDVIMRMARLNNITHVNDAPKGSIQTVVGETVLILPIADIIDRDAELARLTKSIDKLDKDIQKVDAKLGNEKFVQNAPQDVIDEQHKRKEDALAKKAKLQSAVDQLQEE